MPLHVLIEGVLFYKSAPVRKHTLKELFSVDSAELDSALTQLGESLAGRGIQLVDSGDSVQLMTAAVLSELIEALRKEELKADIGKAGAETLAIILYREPVSRAQIDQIRGVNSTFILRNLLTRGLVKRTKSKSGYTFHSTPELLAHLGVNRKEDLTEYAAVMDQIDAFVANNPA